MLFVFRKLRRSFFLPGKVRTYCAYAAGEIVLIVVGILLALQISEWQEDKEEEQWELKVLGELREELQRNIDSFEFSTQEALHFSDAAQFFIEAIDKKLPFDPETMPQKFWFAFQTPWFRIYDSTYRNIETKGLHTIRNDELRKAMTHVYSAEYEEFHLLNEATLGRRNSKSSFFDENFRIARITDYFEPVNYDELIQNPMFSSMLSGSKSQNENLASNWFPKGIAQTKKLLTLIDAELAERGM